MATSGLGQIRRASLSNDRGAFHFPFEFCPHLNNRFLSEKRSESSKKWWGQRGANTPAKGVKFRSEFTGSGGKRAQSGPFTICKRIVRIRTGSTRGVNFACPAQGVQSTGGSNLDAKNSVISSCACYCAPSGARSANVLLVQEGHLCDKPPARASLALK